MSIIILPTAHTLAVLLTAHTPAVLPTAHTPGVLYLEFSRNFDKWFSTDQDCISITVRDLKSFHLTIAGVYFDHTVNIL